MRALLQFPVIFFILAVTLLAQASATPIQSDCMGMSSPNPRVWSQVDRVVGDEGGSQGENGSSDEWIDYFKSFWLYMYEEEPCHHPIPSPSESPIPGRAGEFPKKVQSKKSTEGFNEGAYKKFLLNSKFYFDFEVNETSSEIYDENKATLRLLMKRAERGSLTGDDVEKWQNVAEAILKSYSKEKGAIFFDVSHSQLWTYCGWVKMKKTFVLTDKYMRICVSLISLGMDDITRPPEEGKDFIVPGESDAQMIEKLLEPIWGISGRQSLNKTIRSDSVTVDLLDYPEYCDIPLDLDPNCYAFCCLTPYYGSEFCRDCGF